MYENVNLSCEERTFWFKIFFRDFFRQFHRIQALCKENYSLFHTHFVYFEPRSTRYSYRWIMGIIHWLYQRCWYGKPIDNSIFVGICVCQALTPSMRIYLQTTFRSKKYRRIFVYVFPLISINQSTEKCTPQIVHLTVVFSLTPVPHG